MRFVRLCPPLNPLPQAGGETVSSRAKVLLVTFALLTEELVQGDWALKPLAILPFFMLLFITAFEVLVGFLQAYIFTILTAVYLGSSYHAEH